MHGRQKIEPGWQDDNGRWGDSVRYGFDAIWLTDYKRGLLWRIPSGTSQTVTRNDVLSVVTAEFAATPGGPS